MSERRARGVGLGFWLVMLALPLQARAAGQSEVPLWSSVPARSLEPAERSSTEIGVLYGAAFAYGAGLGVWLDAELGIDDPGGALIAPVLLGIAAPFGVFFADRPRLPEGVPAAITTGMLIGASEGLGIGSYQFVSARAEDAWDFREMSRATLLGATLGSVGGYAFGYFQEPPVESSAWVSSGALWGTAVGAMMGYGASGAHLPYGKANDSGALGALIGLNVGVALTGALSAVYVPSWGTLSWMWGGAGVGAALSLPVYLLYTGDSTAPVKRGLLFTATAVTAGAAAGWLLRAALHDDSAPQAQTAPARIQLLGLAPFVSEGALGLRAVGTIF